LTVHDNVTGLIWTQSPDLDGDGDIDVDDKLAFTDAQTYVVALNALYYGGCSDWRLPEIKELYSLIDFRGTDPPPEGSNTAGLIAFVDSDYFAFAYGDTDAGERIIDAQFLSSTEYVGTVMGGDSAIFGVNLADGRIKGYPADKTHFAYFVRGNLDYGMNDFTDNAAGSGYADPATVNLADLDQNTLYYYAVPAEDEAGNTAYPGCDLLNGDVNDDGFVNPFDIDPFVDLLTGE